MGNLWPTSTFDTAWMCIRIFITQVKVQHHIKTRSSMISGYLDESKEVTLLHRYIKVEFLDKLILRPANNNAKFMWPVIVNRLLTPDLS